MKKKGIINSLLYGNGNDDFTSLMLPKTRKKQFFYILKNNWLKLFYLNLILFTFFLPFIIYYAVSTIYIYQTTSSLNNEEYILQLFSMTVFQYVPLVFFLIIGFMGTSGVNFIIRKMMFDEVVDIKSDFKKGFKYSYKQFAFIGLFLGIVMFVKRYSTPYIMYSDVSPFLQIMLLVMIEIVYVLLIICVMYMANLATLYVMNNFMLIKSGLILAIKELFRNVAIFIITFIPLFIWIDFSYVALMMITPLLLIIFGFSYLLLSFGLLSMYSFDKYVNEKNYPDFYRKGLSKNG